MMSDANPVPCVYWYCSAPSGQDVACSVSSGAVSFQYAPLPTTRKSTPVACGSDLKLRGE